MCHLMLQHISLGLAVMLLNADGSDGVSPHDSPFATCSGNATDAALSIIKLHSVIGLIGIGFLILLSLTCNCIICTVIMSRKAERTVPVSYKKDEEQTRVADEEELWYTTVKFTREANDSDHVTKFDPKSEYATVVINTPVLGTPQLDRVDNDVCVKN